MPPRILPLSEDAISQIRSSKQITSLSGVVLALLENALDAGATKIEISVDFSRGNCTLEDNGSGIPPAEFREDGGLGKMHHTSKVSAEDPLHGTAGSYLVSLASLSLVGINSRHCTEDVSANLSMHQGRVISRQIPSSPANEMVTFPSGTRVVVRDLFGNMPVRVKQRALASASGADERPWFELKRDVAALLLAWRAPCSVKLRDIENQGRKIILSGTHSSVSSSLTEKNLNVFHYGTRKYDLRDSFPILFQAGLAPFESRKHWVPISASTSKISCQGMICLDPAPTRLCQFVSIGIHPCSTASGHSTIYESVNKVFSDSSFGLVEATSEAQHAQAKAMRSENAPSSIVRASKGVDRWPMFILQLKFQDCPADAPRETNEQQLKAIIEVLQAVAREWLTANNFRPRMNLKRNRGDRSATKESLDSSLQSAQENLLDLRRTSVTPSNSATLDGGYFQERKKQRSGLSSGNTTRLESYAIRTQGLDSDIEHLSRIKSSRRIDTGSGGASGLPKHHIGPSGGADLASTWPISSNSPFAMPTLEPGALGAASKNLLEAGRASSEPASQGSAIARSGVRGDPSDDFGSISDTDLLTAATWTEQPVESLLPHEYGEASRALDDTISWQDPITKQALRVNCRTGAVLPADDRPGTSLTERSKRPNTTGMATTPAGRPLTISGRASSATERTSDFVVPGFLKEWQNPVFSRQSEQGIPVASLAGPGMQSSILEKHRCGAREVSDYFSASGLGTQSKLSKQSLQHARIINQVDAKFILCSMSLFKGATEKYTLVLVDQHAASERVILETLLTDLCTPIDPNSPAASFRSNTNNRSGVSTNLLEQPIAFEISAQESTLFLSHAGHFAQYGILYDLHIIKRTRQHHSVAVRTLPPGIAERCRLFPKLLIDLLRSEVWSRVEAGKQSAPKTSAADRNNESTHQWLERLGSCPKGLLDMLNSRACRSAVMFNDELSPAECQDLLRQLADCAFPFTCAHGRVSMVPIGEIEGSGVAGMTRGAGGLLQQGRQSAGEESFVNAFRSWRERVTASDKDDDVT